MNKSIAALITLFAILALGFTFVINAGAAPKGYKFVSTAYGPPWGGIEGGTYGERCSATSGGAQLCQGEQKLAVAVDPKVIPLGTKMKIWPNPFNKRNLIFTAADTGGAIQGRRIDIFIASGRKAQNRWNKRNVIVTPTGKGDPRDIAICTSCK